MKIPEIRYCGRVRWNAAPLFLIALWALPVIVSAQYDPAVPTVVRWAAPINNEDGSCLTGSSESCSADLDSFNIYRSSAAPGEAPSEPVLIAATGAGETSFKDKNLVVGYTYNYFITAVDTSGNESGHSKKVGILALAAIEDEDGDGVANGLDNCALQANADQLDADGDGRGDICGALEDDSGSAEDPDGDLVPAGSDNCREVSNADQADSDEDGVGDACERVVARANCLSQKGGKLSSITIMHQGKVMIINSQNFSTAKTELVSGGYAIVGDFSSATAGPEGFGDLEVSEISKPSAESLMCEINSLSRVDALSFGEVGDIVKGCFIDGDNSVDLVAINSSGGVTIRLSTKGNERRFQISKVEKVIDFTCGDLRGDESDELVVLQKSKKGKGAASSIVTVNASDGSEISRVKAGASVKKLAVADVKGNGKRQVCTLAGGRDGHSLISCGKAGPKIEIPTALDFSAGRYTKGAKGDSFVVVAANSKLSIVNTKGKVRPINKRALSGLTIGRQQAKKVRLAQCR